MALKNLFGDIALEQTQIDVLEQFNSDFQRILEKRFQDTEEVRYDIPVQNALAGNSIYIGVAPDLSNTADPVWSIIRFYFNANALPERARIKKNVQWDNRLTIW